MCQWCVKHGDGGKWYLNTQNYAQKMYKLRGCLTFLKELYKRLEIAVQVTQSGTMVQNKMCCFKSEFTVDSARQ